MDATITATWGRSSLVQDSDQDQWLLEYTEPGVAWDDATEVKFADTVSIRQSLSPRMTHGSITASGDFACPTTRMDSDGTMDGEQGKVIGTASALTDYLHGPPASAPTGFTAYNAGPDRPPARLG